MSFGFEIVGADTESMARAGMLHTAHGDVPTPVFMPVGTQATVKSVSPQELEELGATIILANTYHLFLRPGSAVIRDLGGLHRFAAWPHPILTDSGGFQVMSLAHLRRLDQQGALFRSHIDGSEHLFTPEKVVAIQEELGADIIMALDECIPYPSDRATTVEAMNRTHHWAERCLAAQARSGQALFGIVQGGHYPDLRRASAAFLASLGFPGYAIGGLSVGEPKEMTWQMLETTVCLLPPKAPRYLMGVGSPEDLFEAVARGVDMFDSVLPTRIARNGALLTPGGRLNIRNAAFRLLERPPQPGCDCYTCRTFSAAYLHHLFQAEELLAYRLATIHNLRFLMYLVSQIRCSILEGTFANLRAGFLAGYNPPDPQVRLEQKEKWLASQRRPRSQRQAPE